MDWLLAFNIYIITGMILAIPLARYNWIKWRDTPSKHNIVLPNKLANRTIDAFVFIVSWSIISFLYPIYMIELLIERGKKHGKLHK